MNAQAVVNILLVEDEPKLRRSLTEGLQLEDWHVTSVGSGLEARTCLAHQEFDLVVLDWMLPDCDGLEIARDVRARNGSVPILIITARGGTTAELIAKEAGATSFLAKPFSILDLLTRAKTLMATAA